MSAILLFGFMVAVLLTALVNPFIAVLAYVWISLALPQASVYGALGNVSYALYAAAIGALSVFFGRKHIEWNRSTLVVLMLIFLVWSTVTTITSINQAQSWAMWNQNWKVILSTLLVICACTTRQRLYLLLIVIAGSVALIAAKGAMQFLLTGGSSLVVGPQGGQAGENNAIARYFGIAAPLTAVIMFHARQRWLRILAGLSVLACIIGLIGTDSRGAFVALAVAGTYLFLFSRNRIKLFGGALVAMIAVVLLSSDAALVDWKERMSTVQTRDEDQSYMSRVEAWGYAWELAKARPITGGGYKSFTTDITGERTFLRDFHSIYFEALGDHGFPGLFLMLLLWLTAFYRAVRLYRHCRLDPNRYFERDLGFAAQLSLVFYFVAGITGSHTYNDIVFFLIALIAVADHRVFHADDVVAARKSQSLPGSRLYAGPRPAEGRSS